MRTKGARADACRDHSEIKWEPWSCGHTHDQGFFMYYLPKAMGERIYYRSYDAGMVICTW